MEHSLSKKSYRGGNGYAGKAVYDDVFGGPPKFGVPTLSPRLEDYNEIFEGFHTSRGSSIPMLDLPAVDDVSTDYCLDVRSSRFDYSEVFGGFDAVDFALSYEELFGCSKCGVGGGDDSSDDAWTPAQSESLSDESDPSASLERNQSLSNGDLDQSLGGIMQLKVSHNKASTKTEEHMLNGTGYITHSYVVPGFTAFIKGTQPSRNVVDEKLPLQESSDLNPTMGFGGRVSREKLLRKTESHPSYTESTREIYGRNVEKQCSDGTRPQLPVSSISLKTQPSQLPPPSRPPPTLTVNKKDPGRLNSKLKASKSHAFEQTGGDTSPTYFDVEIDASSSAAVSAKAMKDAVEKAQAKLRSAKESMGKKKEGLQSRLKVSDNDLNKREEVLSKRNDATDSLRNKRMLGDFGGEDNRMRHHAREARDTLKKTAGSIEGQNPVERKHGKEHKSSLGSRKTEVNVSLREEAQFYQNLGENYVKSAQVLNQNTKPREHEQNSRSTVEVFEQNEDGKNISNILDACEWEKQNLSQIPNGTCQWDENTDKLMAPQVCDSKTLRGSQQLGEIETIRKEDSESEECENLIEIQLKEDKVEFENKLNGSSGRLASGKKFKHTNEKQDQGQTQSFDSKYYIGIEEAVLQADNERRLKKSVAHDAKEKQQREGSEREEKEKIQKDHEREGSERGVEHNYRAEENEKRFKKAFEQETTKEQFKMIVEPEGNNHKLVSEIRENEEMGKESQEEEEEMGKESQEEKKNQYKLEETSALEENARKQKGAGERVENENTVTDFLENEEDQTSPKTTWGPEESKREGLESEKSRKVSFKEEGNELKLEAKVGEETENMVQDAGDMVNFNGRNGVHEKVDMEEIDCRLNSDDDIGVGTDGKNLKGSYGGYVTYDVEVPQPTQVSSHDRDSDNIESTQETLSPDGYGKSRIDLRDCDREEEEVVVPEELIEKSGKKVEDTDSCHFYHTESVSNDGGIGIGIDIAKLNIVNDKRTSEMASKLLNADTNALNQVGGKNTKEVQYATDHTVSKDEFTSSHSQEQRDGEKIVDASSIVFEGKRRNTNKSDPKITSQSIGKKDKANEETPEEKEKLERLKREREQEKDRLRKIEEERERQREREKDMMSIDRATLETRERAFVENRERVERATVDRTSAEARQRALAEARERLEKACAEARERTFAGKSSMERSFTEKTSMETRLRAQARERAEKAAADTLTASSRSSGMRQNSSSSDLLDSNFQSVGSYRASRYTHSSAHGGGETESPQRCKARLERHQRTAERAQKALAEKNMRDLLAQKEQSERNRLAEGLDAEVKRWCSGKEGNLRALLSTLQYILGPDSGWQPVPLTDVITTVAVKKAYRKATLCVHPDKLQQRGATIHQKYICEKVFDLLKEAWNKFNSEER